MASGFRDVHGPVARRSKVAVCSRRARQCCSPGQMPHNPRMPANVEIKARIPSVASLLPLAQALSDDKHLQRTSVPYLCQQCHSNTRHPGTLYDATRLPGASSA